MKGNPYKVPQEEFNQTVAEILTGSIWGQPVRFVSTRAPESRSPYRVVWVFDPPWYASYDRMCQHPETIQSEEPSAGSTKISAALCRSDYPVSYIHAGFVAQGPQDPAFRSALQQIELALLPPQNENIRGRDDGGDPARHR